MKNPMKTNLPSSTFPDFDLLLSGAPTCRFPGPRQTSQPWRRWRSLGSLDLDHRFQKQKPWLSSFLPERTGEFSEFPEMFLWQCRAPQKKMGLNDHHVACWNALFYQFLDVYRKKKKKHIFKQTHMGSLQNHLSYLYISCFIVFPMMDYDNPHYTGS